MNENMIAYCGLDCAVCPAHLALLNDDNELRAKQAAKWGSPEYPLADKDINCVGCKVDAEPRFKFCRECAVRACATGRGVETCAHCEDYECGTLEGWLKQAGDEARERLEAIRSTLY
ncbi:MAG: DUF3795 domain-containing protein [Candidatus Thorarchaeota archaeon]|nr:DUF3795 domain-containing protein [Candidatus Thorarchaeota archaeon]